MKGLRYYAMAEIAKNNDHANRSNKYLAKAKELLKQAKIQDLENIYYGSQNTLQLPDLDKPIPVFPERFFSAPSLSADDAKEMQEYFDEVLRINPNLEKNANYEVISFKVGDREESFCYGMDNLEGANLIREKLITLIPNEATEVKRLRDKLETGILSRIYNARLNTGIAERVPNTSNIGFEYIEGELILLHLSDIGICASSGSACTSGSLEPSHVLRAMNVPFTAIHGSIRWSLSRFTTEDEIDYVIEKLPGIIEKVTSISPYQKELKALKELKTVSVSFKRVRVGLFKYFSRLS